MTNTEHTQIHAIKEICKAIYEAIKEAGEAGIPSGHLYAAMMAHLNLDQYNKLIEILKETKLIKEENFLLKVNK